MGVQNVKIIYVEQLHKCDLKSLPMRWVREIVEKSAILKDF